MTDKQVEYLSLYAKGLTVSEIARYSGRSKSTVSTAIKRALNPTIRKPSKPCPHSASCFTCPMHDCAITQRAAPLVNVLV